jgi:hypothetical protein
MQEVQSELLTIDRDTGELVLLVDGKQQSASKIIHLEVGFDELIDSCHISFIHFVEYLYNGLLPIYLFDYSTGHLFATFYLPLRSLLRKRRNEVSLIY